MAREGEDVVGVVIEPKPDPNHIAADIGDDLSREQCLLPRRRSGIAKGQEARVRSAVERVEQFRFGQRGVGQRLDQLRLKPRNMR